MSKAVITQIKGLANGKTTQWPRRQIGEQHNNSYIVLHVKLRVNDNIINKANRVILEINKTLLWENIIGT